MGVIQIEREHRTASAANSAPAQSADDPAAVALLIDAELLATLFGMVGRTLWHAWMGMAGLTLLYASHVPWWQSGGLLATFAAATAGIGQLVRAYERAAPPPAESAAWARRYVALSALTGTCWGLAGWCFADPALPTETLCTGLILTMVMTSSVIHRSNLPRAYLVYAVPALTPFALFWLLQGTFAGVVLGFGILGALAGLLRWSSMLHKTYYRSMALRFENRDLVRQLSAANAMAEQANRAKSQFLAEMSHEIRTPLNAINGFAEMIFEEIIGPIGERRYREYAGHVLSSGRHLLALINDLLDLAKIEAGKMEARPQPLEPADFAASCLRFVQEMAQGRGIRLEPPAIDPHASLFADERLAKQAVINLLSNAVKYTPRGGMIALSIAPGAEGGTAIAVRDSGIGMTAAEITRALEPFGQVEHELNLREKGTGLGLPLVQSLVVLHGGQLALSSAPGAGTTATLWFPAAAEPALAATA
jgi:signal transduction histidine kinase